MTIESLISTSASDCRITLHNRLSTDPLWVAATCLDLLERLRPLEGQSTRRQVAATALRKAVRAIADDPGPDPRGPRAGDPYNEMPVLALRPWIDAEHPDPARAAADMLATLIAIRGEPACSTRREILRLGINKAARSLVYDNSEVPA